MRAYFARPVTHYGTLSDKFILHQLRMSGMEVVDPSGKDFQEGYKLRGMEVFTEAVESCDVVFYRPFEDGAIGAGVWKEIQAAQRVGLPFIKLSPMASKNPIMTAPAGTILTVEETRDRVRRGST